MAKAMAKAKAKPKKGKPQDPEDVDDHIYDVEDTDDILLSNATHDQLIHALRQLPADQPANDPMYGRPWIVQYYGPNALSHVVRSGHAEAGSRSEKLSKPKPIQDGVIPRNDSGASTPPPGKGFVWEPIAGTTRDAGTTVLTAREEDVNNPRLLRKPKQRQTPAVPTECQEGSSKKTPKPKPKPPNATTVQQGGRTSVSQTAGRGDGAHRPSSRTIRGSRAGARGRVRGSRQQTRVVEVPAEETDNDTAQYFMSGGLGHGAGGAENAGEADAPEIIEDDDDGDEGEEGDASQEVEEGDDEDDGAANPAQDYARQDLGDGPLLLEEKEDSEEDSQEIYLESARQMGKKRARVREADGEEEEEETAKPQGKKRARK